MEGSDIELEKKIDALTTKLTAVENRLETQAATNNIRPVIQTFSSFGFLLVGFGLALLYKTVSDATWQMVITSILAITLGGLIVAASSWIGLHIYSIRSNTKECKR